MSGDIHKNADIAILRSIELFAHDYVIAYKTDMIAKFCSAWELYIDFLFTRLHIFGYRKRAVVIPLT